MTLKTAIRQKKLSVIRSIAQETPIADLADILEGLSIKERILFFSLLKTDISANIFSHLKPRFQRELIKDWSVKEAKDIIEELYADDIADLIEEVPANIANKILAAAPSKKRKDVNRLLRYSDDQTGSIMSIDIIALKQTLSPASALEVIHKHKRTAELVHYYFVVNSKGRLIGAVSLEDLVFASSRKTLKDIYHSVGSVTTTTDTEETAREFAKHNRSVMAVTNNQGYLVGMVTADDVIDVIHDVATDDIQKMAGIGISENSYIKASIRSLFKSRVVWLMLLMISATLSQIVVQAFQDIAYKELGGVQPVLDTAVVAGLIVTILPVISGAAGNAGSQSSTMVIRALSTGDISTKDYAKVLSKELRVSLLIGLTLGAANFVRLLIYYSVTNNADEAHIWLSFAASIALFVVVVLAKMVGGMLPLLAKKMHFDPAVMAAPLLTTLIDALSTMIMFSISIGILFVVL